VENGSLLLVNWEWPRAFSFHDEPVAHISCLWRAKSQFRWLGVNDLDEFFLPGRAEKVADVLNRYEPVADQFGALAGCNRWVDGGTRIAELNQCAPECVQHPARQKCIVRVENVDYFCVHRIMLGLPEWRFNASEVMNAHKARGRCRQMKSSCFIMEPFKRALEQWTSALSYGEAK
jgi:hypothetical protein